jgi:TolA-binding protein
MNVVDLHPEELLEKEARGALRDSERIRLETHAAQCATCRVERAMRADFGAELANDVPEPSLTALLRVESILKSEAPVRVLERRRVPRWATWAVAAAALLAASVAGATVGERAWTRFVGPVPTAASSVDALVPATPTHVKHPHRAPPAAASTVAAQAPAAIEPIDTLLPAPTAAVPVEVRAPRPSPNAEAAILFDAASAARRRADYPRAIALHRELESRFGSSREAQVSRATLGRLLLDRGDAAGALASFDAYLASGAGELREETMAGRASALDHLGRASDARSAWESLLVLFPSTPYAAHARARATEASAEPTPSR